MRRSFAPIPALVGLLLAGCAPDAVERVRPTSIPDDAIEISPDVWYLGEMVDPETGDLIEGHAFIDRAPGYGELVEPDEDARYDRRSPTCYKALGYPAWTSGESWGMDGSNSSGMSESELRTNLEAALALWESASGGNIFGSFTSSYSGIASPYADGQNNIQFGNAGGGGTVAVTYVWGARRTAIYEWDQIYGDNWAWTVGDPASSSAFDFLAIAAHETGHAAGLDHPTSSCTDETMYAYVDYGDTFQRTLNTGDVTGINTLY
jgi:hypothetical protein